MFLLDCDHALLHQVPIKCWHRTCGRRKSGVLKYNHVHVHVDLKRRSTYIYEYEQQSPMQLHPWSMLPNCQQNYRRDVATTTQSCACVTCVQNFLKIESTSQSTVWPLLDLACMTLYLTHLKSAHVQLSQFHVHSSHRLCCFCRPSLKFGYDKIRELPHRFLFVLCLHHGSSRTKSTVDWTEMYLHEFICLGSAWCVWALVGADIIGSRNWKSIFFNLSLQWRPSHCPISKSKRIPCLEDQAKLR